MKKNGLDINNLNAKRRANDHMYSDILGSNSQIGGNVKSPGKKPAQDLHLSSNSWSTADLKNQLKKDYTTYSSKNLKHD